MNKSFRFIVSSAVVPLVLIVSAFHPLTAYADDATPPPDSTATETPTTSTDPLATAPASTEPSATDAEPVDMASTESSATEVAPITPAGAGPATDTTLGVSVEAIAAMPAGTDVVVLDSSGAAVPLASEQAADILATGDPMWCPDGHLPGDAACTPGFGIFSNGGSGLLDYLHDHPGIYHGSGTIYVAQTYDSAGELPSIFMDNTSLGLNILTDLTIQGGWDFASNTISGTTTFDKPLNIAWSHSISLNDLLFEQVIANPASLEVTTSSGNITLDRVEVDNNGGWRGALLINNGSGSVTVNDSTFNGNALGLLLISAGDVSISNVAANGSYDNGAFLDNTSGSGNISVSGSTFADNLANGLVARSYGDVTVDSSVFLGNTSSGLYDVSTGDVSLTDVTGSDNGKWGAHVQTNGSIFIDPSSFNGNGADGTFLKTSDDATIICSDFENNGGLGIDAGAVDGTLTLNDVTFIGNSGGDVNSGSGIAAAASGGCGGGGSASGNKHGTQPNLPIPVTGLARNVMQVNDAQQVSLDCTQFSGTELILPNGDRVVLRCPIGDQASLSHLAQGDLAGILDSQFAYVSAMRVAVPVDAQAPVNLAATMTVDFMIPSHRQNDNLSILHWDGSKWVDLGGDHTEDGFFEIGSKFSGDYVLVAK